MTKEQQELFEPTEREFVLFNADRMDNVPYEFLIVVLREVAKTFDLKLAGIPLADIQMSSEEKEELIGKNIASVGILYKKGAKVNLEEVDAAIRDQSINIYQDE